VKEADKKTKSQTCFIFIYLHIHKFFLISAIG